MKYPVRLECTTIDIVVEFLSESVGTVVESGNTYWKVGFTSVNWDRSKFKEPPKKIPTNLLLNNISKWHEDRNLIDGATDLTQFNKLLEEVNELYSNIVVGKSPADDIGDIIVVLVNIAKRNNLTINDCLNTAWNDIKDRKGKMVDGVFVKEV